MVGTLTLCPPYGSTFAAAKTGVRQNANFVRQFKLIWVVQSTRKKYFP
jgi:hypothetical protein